MRAPLLAIPLALAACTPAAGGQDDNMIAAMNAIEEAALAAEAAADAIEGNAFDMETMGNTAYPARPGPAWMAGGTWRYAAEAESGAIWYFEGLVSDFAVRPHRVLLRTDESADPDSLHDNSERLAEVDCAAHGYRILRTTHYDAAGRATEADERGDGRMVAVAPGSVFAQVEENVCRHAEAPGVTYSNGM